MWYGKIIRPCQAKNQNIEGWFNVGDIVEITLDSSDNFPYVCVRLYGKLENYILPKECIRRLASDEEKMIRAVVGFSEAFNKKEEVYEE